MTEPPKLLILSSGNQCLQISKFHQQRVVEFQKALILYAEAKIKTARDVAALLAKDLSTLKQMDFCDGNTP